MPPLIDEKFRKRRCIRGSSSEYTSPQGWSLLQQPSPPRQVFNSPLWCISLKAKHNRFRILAYFASSERMRKLFSAWPTSMSSRCITLASSHTLDSKLTALHLHARIIALLLFLKLFYPEWSSHLARHCIRSLEGCDSVLYWSQLLEDKALLASNKEASSIVLVLWLPTRLTMEVSSRYIFVIVQIANSLWEPWITKSGQHSHKTVGTWREHW